MGGHVVTPRTEGRPSLPSQEVAMLGSWINRPEGRSTVRHHPASRL